MVRRYSLEMKRPRHDRMMRKSNEEAAIILHEDEEMICFKRHSKWFRKQNGIVGGPKW